MELVTPSTEDLLNALEAHDHANKKISTGSARALFKRDLMILTTEAKTGMPVSDKELLTIDASVSEIGKAIRQYDAAFEEYQKSHK